jgi:hypothetical protein
MFELVSSKIKMVTPEMAERFIECNHYQGQRPIRPRHLRGLIKAIETGRFHIGHIVTARQGWNGNDDLGANGQHQCMAVIHTGKTIRAVVEEYACKTPEDFAELYRQFDVHASRNLAERALPEVIALNLDWKKRFITVMLSGIAIVEGKTIQEDNKNAKIEGIKKYTKEGNAINEIITCVNVSESKHLMRSPVIAAMIVTCRKNSADFEEFWEQVRDGENLKGSSPALKLRNFLLSTTVSIGKGRDAEYLNKAASVKEMYSKCIAAWNAYRTHGKTALRYYPDKEAPRAI